MRPGAATAAVAVPIAIALAAMAVGAFAARAEERSFRLAVGAAAPATAAIFAARRGDIVVIAIETAVPAEIHLHGYNLEAKLGAGGTASWRFTAHATGRYQINLHRAGEASGHRHAPPLAFLEVRPR